MRLYMWKTILLLESNMGQSPPSPLTWDQLKRTSRCSPAHFQLGHWLQPSLKLPGDLFYSCLDTTGAGGGGPPCVPIVALSSVSPCCTNSANPGTAASQGDCVGSLAQWHDSSNRATSSRGPTIPHNSSQSSDPWLTHPCTFSLANKVLVPFTTGSWTRC